jgi:methyl-accepting chemotaxis protein
MFKNMKLGTRLITIGTIIMLIPLLVVSVISIRKASTGIEAIEREQMANRSRAIAVSIDNVFKEEKKISKEISIWDAAVDAAFAVSQKGTDNAQTEIASLNAKLSRVVKAKGVGEDYQVIYAAGPDGKAFAASHPEYVGVSFADRQYIKDALAGNVNAGKVGLNKVTGKPFVPIASPIYGSEGTVIGALAVIVDADFVSGLIEGEKIGKTGYAYVIDDTGLIIAHPVKDNIFKTNLVELDGTREFAKKMIAGQAGVDNYVFQGVAKTCGYAPVKTTGWSVGLTLPDVEFLGPITEVRNIVMIVGVSFFVLAFLIYLFFARSVTKPVQKTVEFAQTVADGNLTKQLDIHQRDEIGVMSDAMNRMSENLKSIVTQIKDGAEQIATSSEELAATAQQIAEGAQSQASTLEETSASIEELTASVEQVSDHAQSQTAAVEQSTASMTQIQKATDHVSETLTKVSDIAQQSFEKSVQGAGTVGKAVEAINLISGGSEKIAGIVNVISEIADQTNLLALNASIEAARAGEHGRGFAVVADEVSKLADRSASSTKEIDSLIKESVKNVKSGVELAQASKVSMEEITKGAQKSVEMINELAAAMQQSIGAFKEASKAVGNISEMSQSIGAATEEQTSNAKQTSKAIESVNEITQQAASAAEEMASSTEELSSMAQQLQGLVAQFTVDEKSAETGREAGRLLPHPKTAGTAAARTGAAGGGGKTPKSPVPPEREITDITLKRDKAA